MNETKDKAAGAAEAVAKNEAASAAETQQAASLPAEERGPHEMARIKIGHNRMPLWLLAIWIIFFIWMIVYAFQNMLPELEKALG